LRGEPFDKLRAVSPSNGVRVRVEKVRGSFPLTSILSPGGARKIKVRDFSEGERGGFVCKKKRRGRRNPASLVSAACSFSGSPAMGIRAS